MRHIARNQITSIAADSQDGNFPASNLLDGRPGRLWKAGGLTRNATLTMEMRGGVSDVALFGTNAREATATVEDPCAVTFGTNTDTENIVTNGTFITSTGWTLGSGWAVSLGKLSHLSPIAAATAYRSVPTESGEKYLYRATFSAVTSGGCKIRPGSTTTGTYRTADGTYDEVLTASASATVVVSPTDDFLGSVDDIEIYAITPDILKGGDVLKNTDITTTTTTTVDENGNALRVNFNPAVTVPCEVAINLTSPGNETLCAGVAFGGTAETYGGANFRYGAGVALNDYSITAQNSNGSRYYKKRTIGKQYNLTALMLRTEADKLEATIRQDGAIASAWALFDNSSEMIYGWPQLQRSMDHRMHDNIQLTITEEI